LRACGAFFVRLCGGPSRDADQPYCNPPERDDSYLATSQAEIIEPTLPKQENRPTKFGDTASLRFILKRGSETGFVIDRTSSGNL
jgi:hypothetical protein